MMTAVDGGKLKVGIVGATGAVGEEIVKVLGNRQFPVSELHLYASARSAGKSVPTPFGSVTIEEFELGNARGLDVIFLAVGGDFSLKYAHKLSEGDGPVVIDNSSAFRMDPDVPLVVPEINHKTAKGKKLIANPNCTTAIGLMALFPLHVAYGIKKVIMSTYQAASGAGAEGAWCWEGRGGKRGYIPIPLYILVVVGGDAWDMKAGVMPPNHSHSGPSLPFSAHHPLPRHGRAQDGHRQLCQRPADQERVLRLPPPLQRHSSH